MSKFIPTTTGTFNFMMKNGRVKTVTILSDKNGLFYRRNKKRYPVDGSKNWYETIEQVKAKETLDGTSKKLCICGHKSIAGFKPNYAFCPFHWAKKVWGFNWAAKCYPTHPEVLNLKNFPLDN